jgi:glycerol kinase
VTIDEIVAYTYTDDEIQSLKKMHKGNDYLGTENARAAYFMALEKLVADQVISMKWVLQYADVDEIVVDGGFAQNKLFMQLLGFHFQEKTIIASTTYQGSSLGAAMVLKEQVWKS